MVSHETVLTVLMLVSRDSYKETLESLSQQTPRTRIQFCILVDSRTINRSQVIKQIRELFGDETRAYIQELKYEPALTLEKKRERVKANYTLLKYLAPKSELYFIVEDDTLLPSNALSELLYIAVTEHEPLVSGLQAARHGTPAIGAWRATPEGYLETLPYDETLSRADAVGLYCLLATREALETLDFTGERPADINATLYRNIRITWDVLCGHLNGQKTIVVSQSAPIVQYDIRGGKWTYRSTK